MQIIGNSRRIEFDNSLMNLSEKNLFSHINRFSFSVLLEKRCNIMTVKNIELIEILNLKRSFWSICSDTNMSFA